MYFLFLLVLFFSQSVLAQTTSDKNTAPAKNLFFCPPTESLIKDRQKMTWSAQSGQWQSYGVSFVNQLSAFVGAQWSGAEVGQITCIYKGSEVHSFPVLLVFHTITWEPQGSAWTKNLGGYRNCLSSNPEDCPFHMRLAPKTENLYEEAEKLKKPDEPMHEENP